MVRCIVCGGGATRVLERYDPKDFERAYQHYYRNVQEGLFEDSYEMVCCEKCNLVFANPLKAGSPRYYEWISKQNDYYTRERWEWKKISDYLLKSPQQRIRILEVGCGQGFFLDYIKERNPDIDAVGVDLTNSSVDECKKKGHNAFCGTLEDYLENNPNEKFDYVMSFHCLEHVYNPKQFVIEMLSICKDDGLCINSIPYTTLSKPLWWDVLNSPPHHMTRWCLEAMNELARQVNCNMEVLAADSFNAREEAVNMMKLEYFPVYDQPESRLRILLLLIRHPLVFFKEFRRMSRREKTYCSSDIGGILHEITIPHHVTMIFRKSG